MTYTVEQLRAMSPANISECSQKHVQSVVAELIETVLSQPASVPAVVTPEMADQAPAPAPEPVAVRYDFDGYGWKYIDNGSGSDWMTRHPDGELLYDGPCAAVKASAIPAGWSITDNLDGSITVDRRGYQCRFWKSGHGGGDAIAYELAHALLKSQPPVQGSGQ